MLVLVGLGCQRAAPEAPVDTAGATPSARAASPTGGDAPSSATGLSLTCPTGLSLVEHAGVRGQRVLSCLDDNGERQGMGMVLRGDGTRLAITTFKDDQEQGALSLFDEQERVIARGETAGDRLLRYELDAAAAQDNARLAPLTERLKDELGRAQSCEKHADCVVAVAGKCPFGCGLVAHRGEAARMTALLNAYPEACQYKCQGGGEPRCRAGRCELAYH